MLHHTRYMQYADYDEKLGAFFGKIINIKGEWNTY